MSTLLPIGVVAEKTGVAAATLRAWERRYGVPAPQRTEGGRRVYEAGDVELVRQLKRLSEAGIPPSVAVLRLAALETDRTEQPGADERTYIEVVNRILNAIDSYDPGHLDSELRRIMHLGDPLEVFARVMVPVMGKLGEMWDQDSNLAIAQEHLTTETFRVIAQDLHRLSLPAAPVGRARHPARRPPGVLRPARHAPRQRQGGQDRAAHRALPGAG